jgi:hypothetical protein
MLPSPSLGPPLLSPSPSPPPFCGMPDADGAGDDEVGGAGSDAPEGLEDAGAGGVELDVVGLDAPLELDVVGLDAPVELDDAGGEEVELDVVASAALEELDDFDEPELPHPASTSAVSATARSASARIRPVHRLSVALIARLLS